MAFSLFLSMPRFSGCCSVPLFGLLFVPFYDCRLYPMLHCVDFGDVDDAGLRLAHYPEQRRAPSPGQMRYGYIFLALLVYNIIIIPNNVMLKRRLSFLSAGYSWHHIEHGSALSAVPLSFRGTFAATCRASLAVVHSAHVCRMLIGACNSGAQLIN